MTGKFLEEKSIWKCFYSAFPLDFYFWSQQTTLQPPKLWPQRRPESHRKLPGVLPLAISISYCSPLIGTKQGELRGRESRLSVERLWETLWKVGFSLASSVACHHVWFFLWFLYGCLAEDYCWNWAEMPRKSVGFWQHGEADQSSAVSTKHRPRLLALPCLPPQEGGSRTMG